VGEPSDTRTRPVPEPAGPIVTPRPGHRFPLLDGLRALAASAVLVTHVGFHTGAAVTGPWAGPLARLDVGVAIFFVLSGFLLYRPVAVAHLVGGRAPKVRPYLWHRFLRIVPAYWLAVLGAWLLLPENRTVPIGRWLTEATFLSTFRSYQLLPGLTQMWSLGTEVCFYLFLPLLAVVVVRLGGRSPRARLRRQLVVLLLLCLGSWGYRVAAAAGGWSFPATSWWLPAFLDWFAAGMALAAVSAYLSTEPTDQWRRWVWVADLAALPGTCWTIALAAWWVTTTHLAGPFDLAPTSAGTAGLKHLLYGVTAAFLVLPGIRAQPGRGVVAATLQHPVLRWLGTVSYGIFLWNMIVVTVVMRVLDFSLFGGSFALVLLVTYLATALIAAASWYLVERPTLRLRRLVT
jgi:peptidoglycan/LPS O-acetylase OafA/YrhL